MPKLSLGLIVAMSFAAVANAADFETRKQAMIQDIQTQISRTNLTTQGLVNVFTIAYAHGFLKTDDQNRWTGEGGDQLGLMNVAAADGKSVQVRRNMYWSTERSEVFCDAEAVTRVDGYPRMLKGKEKSCFELASSSTQTTNLMFVGTLSMENQNGHQEFTEQELNDLLLVNYEANVYFDKNNRLQTKLTDGGTYEQTIYLWNMDNSHPSRDGKNSPRVNELKAQMEKAVNSDNGKEQRRLVLAIESQINGQPIAQVKSPSNIDRRRILKDFSASGLYSPQLNEKNMALAQSLAKQMGSAKTQQLVNDSIEQLKLNKKSQMDEELAIARAGLDKKSDNELKSEQQCKIERNANTYRGEVLASCKYLQNLRNARLQSIDQLSEVRRAREQRFEAEDKFLQIHLEGLADLENDASFLRVMLSLSKK